VGYRTLPRTPAFPAGSSYRKTRLDREEIGKFDGETGLAPQQDVMGEYRPYYRIGTASIIFASSYNIPAALSAKVEPPAPVFAGVGPVVRC